MGNQFVEAVRRAIDKLVAGFQEQPERYWNERDMHWSLFYYLKQEGAAQEDYPTQLIRAEFPTLSKFGPEGPARGERGHYDLVILEPASYFSEDVQSMTADTPWQEFLEKVKVAVAVEIKLWLAKLRSERVEEYIQWDIDKLTEEPNNVENGYFLNFVKLDFSLQKTKNREYYEKLRAHLMEQKRKHQDLRILCVPSNKVIQPPSENWLLPL